VRPEAQLMVVELLACSLLLFFGVWWTGSPDWWLVKLAKLPGSSRRSPGRIRLVGIVATVMSLTGLGLVTWEMVSRA